MPHESMRSPSVRCLVCRDARIVQVDQGQEGSATPIARYERAGSLPARALIACPACAGQLAEPVDHFGDLAHLPHQAAAVAAARNLALGDNPIGLFTLTGGYGSGKSTIAETMCRTLKSRGLTVRAYTAKELKDAMYRSFSEGTYSAWLTSLKRTRALFVDELDSIRWADQHVEETMSDLLDTRYREARVTLTILAGANLSAVPGRILSRMRQHGIHDLGGTDLRAQEDAAVWDRGE